MSVRVIYSLQCCPYSRVLKPRQFFRRNFSSATPAEVEVNFDNDRERLKFSTGRYARLANGCAVAELGNTSVMVTAVSKTRPSSVSFLPLTVDYRQKAAAAGRIPTNFLRRELHASDQEILVSRLIDRSLRPLFPHGYNYETQIMCNLLAVDSIHDPEILSINAASAALAISDIPWNGPIGAVRLGFIDEEFIVNPTRQELINSSLNLVVSAASKNLVVMLEGSAKCVKQQDLMKGIKVATKECHKIVNAISFLRTKFENTKRNLPVSEAPSEELVDSIRILCEMRLREILSDYSHDKLSRDEAIRLLKDDVIDKTLSRNENIKGEVISEIFDAIFKELFRRLIFENERRCDGRGFSDLRDISCDINLYKPLHGSALFQRGQTQVLCTVSLDSIDSSMKLDPVTVVTSGLKEKNFFLHYEFPPYATKEIGRSGAGRRELGHGALAEKGLRPVIPSDFPFAIRLTSEVLESNGSSSMASVCGGSLALMDAGISISEPAAGVAIGLVSRPSSTNSDELQYQILTDILGIEDYLGDMDFKIAGTKKGITALQADIKLPGVPVKVVMDAITAAVEAKSKIIGIMNRVIAHPRPPKDNWPKIEALDIPPHLRGKLVGTGGINLKRLMAETGAQITTDEEGSFTVFAPNQDALIEAKEFISKLLETDGPEPILEFGCIYTAKIVELRDAGVMVTLYKNMNPALLHNSQLDQRKINHPSALDLEVGQEIQVKYFGRDPVSGLMRLSRKVLQGPSSTVKTLRQE